jgi:hypothetical protein
MDALPQWIKDCVDRLWAQALAAPGELKPMQDLVLACQILTIKLAALELAVRLPDMNDGEVLPMDG